MFTSFTLDLFLFLLGFGLGVSFPFDLLPFGGSLEVCLYWFKNGEKCVRDAGFQELWSQLDQSQQVIVRGSHK